MLRHLVIRNPQKSLVKLGALIFSIGLQLCGVNFASAALNVPEIAEKSPYSNLWLDYSPVSGEKQAAYRKLISGIFSRGAGPILQNAKNELTFALSKIADAKLAEVGDLNTPGTLLVGTLADWKEVLSSQLIQKVERLKDDGFILKSTSTEDFGDGVSSAGKHTLIIAKTESGVLYGVFHFVRMLQLENEVSELSITENPDVDIRLLNHWDNIGGGIERGYAGKSLWNWKELPAVKSERLYEYARFCASVGINATVLNNVNADPRLLRKDFLVKVAALASVFREWGIRTYLSINWGSPLPPSDTPEVMKKWGGVGNLKTADPLDEDVRKWWKAKADEIYELIPDFGGFLVKANSEGMPGPLDYGRTHADGANMLGDALQEHGGFVFWRAFVYGEKRNKDRATHVYDEFKNLDGNFQTNVFLQVKNGPLDFQPREVFSAPFGGMKNTDVSIELQVSKEYLGFSTTMTFLAPFWHEVMTSDTYQKGKGSTVAKVIDGTLFGRAKSAIAGVANTGSDQSWCGNIFNQANWYAYGRIAWHLEMPPEDIAKEWIRLTLTKDAQAVSKIQDMMLSSHQATVDYMTPLGLAFLCDPGHYKPGPARRTAYHGGNSAGLGLDRTSKGSGFVNQYAPELAAVWNDKKRVPLNYLLWFHHIGWDEKISTGRTLSDELEFRYNHGVSEVSRFISIWESLKGEIVSDKYESVLANLAKEKEYAENWRDVCLKYFHQLRN